jgi:MYXO-CTERM domain-containing protein
MFSLFGTTARNINGYFEISVLDLTGWTGSAIEQVLFDFGSVEGALDAGAFDLGMVLFSERESSFIGGNFSRTIDVGSLDASQLAVIGVTHAVSTPTPGATAVLGLAGLGLVKRRRR